MIKSNNSISPNQVLTIFNILRSLGFNSSHRGSKFINKSVQFVISYDTDIIILEDIYSKIAENYINVTPEQVKNDINYAINSRNKKRSEANFKSIFGFEYELSYFTNKKIIEEIARIVYYSWICYCFINLCVFYKIYALFFILLHFFYKWPKLLEIKAFVLVAGSNNLYF